MPKLEHDPQLARQLEAGADPSILESLGYTGPVEEHLLSGYSAEVSQPELDDMRVEEVRQRILRLPHSPFDDALSNDSRETLDTGAAQLELNIPIASLKPPIRADGMSVDDDNEFERLLNQGNNPIEARQLVVGTGSMQQTTSTSKRSNNRAHRTTRKPRRTKNDGTIDRRALSPGAQRVADKIPYRSPKSDE